MRSAHPPSATSHQSEAPLLTATLNVPLHIPMSATAESPTRRQLPCAARTHDTECPFALPIPMSAAAQHAARRPAPHARNVCTHNNLKSPPHNPNRRAGDVRFRRPSHPNGCDSPTPIGATPKRIAHCALPPIPTSAPPTCAPPPMCCPLFVTACTQRAGKLNSASGMPEPLSAWARVLCARAEPGCAGVVGKMARDCAHCGATGWEGE